MKIQWYPGHMYKARKQIIEMLPRVHLILEILDARIPFSSRNPVLEELRDGKPGIIILAKADLADPVITKQWMNFLQSETEQVIALNLKQTGSTKSIPGLCHSLLAPVSRNRPVINALVVGIPNAGKSTFINALAGRAVANTGDEPAVTKQQQQVAIGEGLMLFDTPGVLWPNVENRHSGYRLAITGGIRETAFDYADVALYAAEYLCQAYPERLKQRFELDELPIEPLELLDLIGRRRGCLVRGGVVDLDRISRIFLGEIRSGELGQISLETPKMMDQERIEVEVEREEKAAKTAERKARRKKSRG
jgi:ribosome biogenesis GTPase A